MAPSRLGALGSAVALLALTAPGAHARPSRDAAEGGVGPSPHHHRPRALLQFTLKPTRPVPRRDELRLPWQTARPAAAADMGRAEKDDDAAKPAVDYDELDADYAEKRAIAKIRDPVEKQLAEWYNGEEEDEALAKEREEKISDPEIIAWYAEHDKDDYMPPLSLIHI